MWTNIAYDSCQTKYIQINVLRIMFLFVFMWNMNVLSYMSSKSVCYQLFHYFLVSTSTGTLWQKFHKLCMIVLLCHRIIRQQKISLRYENMVFFTLTRSFFYRRTMILNNLLFVVCAVFFFSSQRCIM